MNYETDVNDEFVKSTIAELEEALDLLCPCPENCIITKSVCDACRLEEPCRKIHKVAVALRYIF